jgi:hypothetical protein
MMRMQLKLGDRVRVPGEIAQVLRISLPEEEVTDYPVDLFLSYDLGTLKQSRYVPLPT